MTAAASLTPATPTRLASRPKRLFLLLAVVFGVLSRVRQYAANTSLWHDESFVALNIVDTPFTHLLGALDWHEPSPPGFLAVEKLVVASFGTSEYALRALPLMAALAALLVFAWLAQRVCASAAGAACAVLLLAASAKLITDASQVKHFSIDLLVSATLVGMAWQAYCAVPTRSWWLRAWGGVGALGLWFSYATAFVFAGTSLVLMGPAARRWPRSDRSAYVVGNALTLASALVLIAPIRAQRSGAVVDFWSRAFPDTSSPFASAVWFARAVVALFAYFWQPFGGIVLLLALLAFPLYWRSSATNAQRATPTAERRHAQRRPILFLLWLPIALALLASALHAWPFGGNQHMAWAAPAVLLLAGDGLAIAFAQLAVRHRRLAWGAAALVLAPGMIGALYHLVVPRYRHELRPVIDFMRQRSAPGDALAVFDPATFQFYTGRDLRAAPLPAASAPRVWVITPRSPQGDLHPNVQRIVEHLAHERPRLAGLEVHGAAAYLFGARLTGRESISRGPGVPAG